MQVHVRNKEECAEALSKAIEEIDSELAAIVPIHIVGLIADFVSYFRKSTQSHFLLLSFCVFGSIPCFLSFSSIPNHLSRCPEESPKYISATFEHERPKAARHCKRLEKERESESERKKVNSWSTDSGLYVTFEGLETIIGDVYRND